MCPGKVGHKGTYLPYKCNIFWPKWIKVIFFDSGHEGVIYNLNVNQLWLTLPSRYFQEFFQDGLREGYVDGRPLRAPGLLITCLIN